MSWKLIYWALGAVALLPLLNFLVGIHPPRFRTNDDPARYGLYYEDVSFNTIDGLTLRGWFIPAASEDKGTANATATILVGHGYPFDKANILNHALFLHGHFNVLLFDFRYFGESEGWYTTAGLLETRDVDAAVSYLKRRTDVDQAKIGAMGFSMSAAAFMLARHSDIRAIVADSPYADLEGLVARQFSLFPWRTKWPFLFLTKLYARFLLGLKVADAAPKEAVKRLMTPLLIVHGNADSQIPVAHTYQIQANANPETTEVWIVQNADHGMAHASAGHRYELRVKEFFERYLTPDIVRPEP